LPPIDEPSAAPQPAIHRRIRVIGAAAVAIVAVLAGVYGIGRLRTNPTGAGGCSAALATAAKLAPLAQGEVAALAVAHAPFRVPDLAFKGADGHERTLQDWHGRTVLVNLWATWCVPCRKEMPALDALEAKLGGPNFEVVAINIDTRDPQKPLAFLKDADVTHLAYYSDPTAKVFQDLKLAGKAFGMPTTVLVSPSGCELGTMAGPAEWASEDGVRLVSAAIGSAPRQQ
jgi:thiol-disulfide isomerase/thioredoxin